MRKQYFIILLFLAGLTQPVSAVTEDIPPVLPDAVAMKSVSAARVISCAIVFPLDQVRFSEQQVEECMKSVNLDAVSYVHVIATSSTTGSSPHNLYLSNRRAGAIEAFLTNRYPNIMVHAFGGGENPKFGKMARIFIVENIGPLEDIKAGVQIASAGPPEIIERTTTKYVTKTEYRDRPKRNLDVAIETGPARTDFSSDSYNYMAVRLSSLQNVPFAGRLRLGVSHRVFQSNEVIDINATGISAARSWPITHIFARELLYEQSIDAGILQANGRSLEWGTTGTLGLESSDFRTSLQAAKTNHVTTIGLGFGVRM